MEDNLTQEEMQQLWNEEATKLDTDENNSSVTEQATALDADEAPPRDEQDLTEAAAAPTEEVEEDPLAGLSPAVRAKLAQIDDLAQANAQLLHHVKTAEGRVAAMQREFQAARQAATTVAPQDAPSQGQLAKAAANPEKWEQLKQDFPEWAGAMEEYVTSKLGSVNNTQGLTSEQVSNYVNQQVEATRVEMRKAIEEARIEGKYENWRDVVNTTEFAQWYAVQPASVRSLADSAAAKDALKMLDMFHTAKERPAAEIKQERGARLAAAATTRPGTSKPTRTLDDMSPEELWNYEAAKRDKTKAQRGF